MTWLTYFLALNTISLMKSSVLKQGIPATTLGWVARGNRDDFGIVFLLRPTLPVAQFLYLFTKLVHIFAP